MNLYAIIIGSTLVLTALSWAVTERLARGRWWVWLARVFLGGQIALFLVRVGDNWLSAALPHGGPMPQDRPISRALPASLYAAELIWDFLGIGLVIAIAMVVTLVAIGRGGRAAWRRSRARGAGPDAEIAPAAPVPAGPGSTRREFLGLAAAALPPLFTFSLTGVARAQLSHFRVRRFTLALPGLPRDLEGMSIAQVSDIHVGPFTSDRLLRSMVDAVNELRADLVLLTGDLINRELSDLSGALDLARAMPGRFGQCLIEGNHDLFEDAREFDARARASGIPFLRDESIVLTVRGQPVQLLGVRWSEGTPAQPREAAIAQSVRSVLPLRQAGAFPILLAHHPHAFDAAAAAGLPLTLSGHTHGGQLMLNDHEGAGPLLFRYWSGRYVRGSSQLIVSNGVGNWFPLRVNAPAEIVYLTLRRA